MKGNKAGMSRKEGIQLSKKGVRVGRKQIEKVGRKYRMKCRKGIEGR